MISIPGFPVSAAFGFGIETVGTERWAWTDARSTPGCLPPVDLLPATAGFLGEAPPAGLEIV